MRKGHNYERVLTIIAVPAAVKIAWSRCSEGYRINTVAPAAVLRILSIAEV
jgi:hypothetical protein